MTPELLAGLIGGLLALLGGLVAQAFGAWLSKRRRVRELCGRHLATLKSVTYIAERTRIETRHSVHETVLLALQTQTEVISLGSELEMIGPRFLREPTRASVNGAISLLAAHNRVGDREWALARVAFDRAVLDFNTAIAKIF